MLYVYIYKYIDICIYPPPCFSTRACFKLLLFRDFISETSSQRLHFRITSILQNTEKRTHRIASFIIE